MKSKSLSHNYFFNLCYQVMLVAVPFITTPYLSRVFGPEGIGRYSFAQSIASYFVLLSVLGTTMYGQRRIASLRHDPEQLTISFFEIVILRVITTAVSLAIYYSVITYLEYDITLYALVSLEVLAAVFDVSWFFQGVEDFGVISGCNAVWKLVTVVAVFLFVHDIQDLPLYALIYCAGLLLTYLSQWTFLRHYLKKGVRISRTGVISHLKPAVSLFIAQSAIQVYTVLDKTMIGVITKSEAQNGYYEQAQKLIRVLQAVITSIGAVITSRVAILRSEDKQEQINTLILQSFRLVLAIGMPVIAGVSLVAYRFVPIFYGPGYDEIVPLLYLLSVLLVATGCSNVSGIQYLVPMDRERDLTRSVLIGSAVNVVLNAILIGKYQAIGAALASVIAELCVTGTQFLMIRKNINLKPIFGYLIRYALYCIPMLALGHFVDGLAPDGIIGLVLVVLPCVVCYFVMLLLLKDPVIAVLLSWRKE